MKIRTDFVTNSSSSSFTLAYFPDYRDSLKTALIDLIINACDGEDTFRAKVISDENELDSSFEALETMDRAIGIISKGGVILQKTVGDDTLMELIRVLVNNKVLEKLSVED